MTVDAMADFQAGRFAMKLHRTSYFVIHVRNMFSALLIALGLQVNFFKHIFRHVHECKQF